jgi:hypothetical protein
MNASPLEGETLLWVGEAQSPIPEQSASEQTLRPYTRCAAAVIVAFCASQGRQGPTKAAGRATHASGCALGRSRAGAPMGRTHGYAVALPIVSSCPHTVIQRGKPSRRDLGTVCLQHNPKVLPDSQTCLCAVLPGRSRPGNSDLAHPGALDGLLAGKSSAYSPVKISGRPSRAPRPIRRRRCSGGAARCCCSCRRSSGESPRRELKQLMQWAAVTENGGRRHPSRRLRAGLSGRRPARAHNAGPRPRPARRPRPPRRRPPRPPPRRPPRKLPPRRRRRRPPRPRRRPPPRRRRDRARSLLLRTTTTSWWCLLLTHT